jgi:hypothetical protein
VALVGRGGCGAPGADWGGAGGRFRRETLCERSLISVWREENWAGLWERVSTAASCEERSAILFEIS